MEPQIVVLDQSMCPPWNKDAVQDFTVPAKVWSAPTGKRQRYFVADPYFWPRPLTTTERDGYLKTL